MSPPGWLVGRDGRVIWDGDSNALLPDPGTLVREIRSAEGVPDLSLLRHCVVLVLVHAAPASLPMWCSWLCCLGDPGPTMRNLRDSSGGSRVCGYVFKRGDIAWNCRRCQVDSTCVQCDACFRRSDHTGHPVYFHRTSPGGCCDCGDEEAWAEAGCCDKHRAPRGDKGSVDPLASLPPDFEAVARLVVRGVVLFLAEVAWSSLDTFNPASLQPATPNHNGKTPGGGDDGSGPSTSSGTGRGRRKAAAATAAVTTGAFHAGGVRRFGGFTVAGGRSGSQQGQGRRRQQDPGGSGEKKVMVRVHNDDVHTFEQVIGTFTALGLQYDKAMELTQQVDEKGIATVLHPTRDEAIPILQFLSNRGLMASVCDEAHVELESRGLALLNWLGSLCSQTDGLRRIVAQELVTAARSSLPLQPGGSGGGGGGKNNTSPLARTPTPASGASSDPTAVTGAAEDEQRVGKGKAVVASSDSGSGEGGDGSGERDATWEPYSSLERRSDVFGLSAEQGLLWVNQLARGGDGGEASPEAAAAPPYRVVSNAPLGVLVGAGPMLARLLRMALHGLLMRLLVDQEFKRDFALAFARLYEFLNSLYCRGIGVSDESIFAFSVQTFTTPSLVRLLADVSATTSSALLPNPAKDGVPRVWGFAETPGLLAMLMKALLRTMRDAGCHGCGRGGNDGDSGSGGDESAFLEHDITVHKRFTHIFRDLEYALQSPGTALDMATLTANPGPGSEPLKLWLKVLSDLQYMDTNVRRVGSHVEYDSPRFYGAFGLTFCLAGVSDALIDRALRKAPPTPLPLPASSTSADSLRNPAATSPSKFSAGGAGGVGGGGWAEESRRIEAGEVLSWRAVAALKAWVDARNGTSVYRVVTTPPLLCRLIPVLGQRVQFDVHCHAVSLHLPLHRFFCKVVQTLAQEGMAIPRVPEDCLLPLVEFPMRALVFHAQVMARLWVRNGVAAQHQATNYTSPPLCRHMRDLDMIALQVGCLYMGADIFLGLLLNKFDMDEWLIDPAREADPQQSATSSNTRPPLSHQLLLKQQQQQQLQQQQRRRANYAALMGAPSAGPVMPVPPQALTAPTARIAAADTAGVAAAGGVAALTASEQEHQRRIKRISSGARLLLSEDCLSLLIALLTELPRPAGRASARGALRREVVHRLASSECTHSEIASVVANLTDPAAEEFLDEILREVGEVRDSSASARFAAASALGGGESAGDSANSPESGGGGGGRGGAMKYSLAASAAGEYDPTFVRLNRAEHQAAVETIARKRRSLRSSSSSSSPEMASPLVGPPSPAHPKFLPVRWGLLYSQVVVRTVRTILHQYATKESGKTSDLLFSRALHLLTLQLHGLGRQRDHPEQEAGFGGTEETKGFDCNTSSTSGGGGGGFGSEDDDFSAGVDESAYFAAVLEKPAGGRGSAVGRQLRGRECSSRDEKGDGEAEDGSLCEMLGKVARDHGALGVLFEDGLQWIVHEFARRSPACRETLIRLGALPESIGGLEVGAAGGSGGDGGSMNDGRGVAGDVEKTRSASSSAKKVGGDGRGAGLTLAEKKKKAQAMAMEVMRKRQAAFAKHAGLGRLGNDSADDYDAAAATEGGPAPSKAEGSNCEASLEEGSPECIMCHERSGRAMGYLGLAQRSPVLGTSVAGNPHRGLLRRQMLVVGPHGCQVRRGIDVTSEKVKVLPPGRRCEVLVKEQVGRRVRCVAPAVGWASMRNSDGEPILAPLENKAFGRWGRQRLHVGLCGHAVHFSCWDTYFASLLGRAMAHQTFDGRVSVDVNRSEFFCPLCKSLSNTLIAHVPRGAHASTLSRSDITGEDASTTPEQKKQQQQVREEDVVKRLASAEGLAKWVLLEEDGGVGVVGVEGRDDMDVEDAGFVVGGDVIRGKRDEKGNGRKERMAMLQFGVPRSGLGGELAAGFARHGTLKGVKSKDGVEGGGGRAGYENLIETLRRLADSLDEASCPPWNAVSDSHGHFASRQKPSGVRMLHQMWAAAGYTAASSEAASREEWTPCATGGRVGSGVGYSGRGAFHGGEVLRANESLHLRRFLRVVEHGTALLDDEQRSTCATAVAAATAPSTGRTVQVHPQAGEAAQLQPPAPATAPAAAGGGAASAMAILPGAAANSTHVLPPPTLASVLAAAAALPAGVSRGGQGVMGTDGDVKTTGGELSRLGVGGGRGGSFAGNDASDVLVPAGGAVVAIKLARVIGGAAVVPPAEGIKKPGVAEEGRGGRKKQGARRGSNHGQWMLRREEAAWIRQGVEVPMLTVWDERSLNDNDRSRVVSFQKKQQEALRRAVAVARAYFISERRRERVNNQAEATSSAGAGAADADADATVKTGAEDKPKIPLPSALFQRLSPESTSALETVWEADTMWPLMQMPLLGWDVTTLLVGALSMARSWSGRAGVVRTACLARLCQTILQPEACLRGPGGATAAAAMAARSAVVASDERGPRGQKRRQTMKPPAGGSDGGRGRGGGESGASGGGGGSLVSAATALQVLRTNLAEATGTPVAPVAPTKEDLVAMCYESWLPFLRCAALLIAAASSSDNSSDAEKSGAGGGGGGASGVLSVSGEEAISSGGGGEEAWRQRVAAAYNSSGRLFNGNVSASGSGGMPGGIASAFTAYRQADCDGKAGGSRDGCVAAVEGLCAAIGVPLPQEVVNSTSAMTMVRCWGKQFAGAFGPAQKGAGVCGIGGETLSPSAVEACLRKAPKRGLPEERDAYGLGGGGGGSVGTNGDMIEALSDISEHGDDAAAATADGIEDGVASGAAAGGSISVLGMNMNMSAEMSADVGVGAAEEMGFDVLDIGEAEWIDLGMGGGAGGGGGGEGAGVWGAAEFVLEDAGFEDALEGVEDEDNSEGDSENDQGQEEAGIDDADGDSAAASSDDSVLPGPAAATANSLPPPPLITQDIATASQWLQLSPPLGVYPTAQGHQSNQAARGAARRGGSALLWRKRGSSTSADRTTFSRWPFPKILVPYLGNLTGGHTTPDVTGVPLKGVLFDLSHHGLSCQDNLDLVDLPESYTELYGRAQSPHASAAAAAAAAEGSAGHEIDPAVCLVCGQVVAAGSKPQSGSVGECTLHARDCGSGVGVFFLVQRCVVLLIRDSRGAYYPSIYLDDHGEEDTGLKRGRPLFLNRHRYNTLKQLYLRHRVAQEVSTIRASSDRVIRENYY